MIYLELLIGFLKVGCFSFGGAYGAIPLIMDVVMSYGWMDQDMLAYMIAVSESTPGPIMVNLATYIGSNQAGLLGSIIATTAVVLPSFFIILLVMVLFKKALKNKYFQAVLRGIKPSVIGIVLATGTTMVLKNGISGSYQPILIYAILIVIMYLYSLYFKKKLSPILLIVLSAILGIVLY